MITGLLDAAERLGFAVTASRGASGGSVSPCPACSAALRHTKRRDRRGAVGVRQDGQGGRCFQCDASFNVVGFVSWALCECEWSALNSDDRSRVVSWLRDNGNERPLRAWQAPAPAPEPCYPPEALCRGFWEACQSAAEHQAVARWLRDERAIDPGLVTEYDLARARPLRPVPGVEWWPENELIVPLFDSTGRMRSALARACRRDAWAKSLGWKGYQRAGLVMADAHARELLRTAARPEDCAPRLVVCEGEPDYLVAATTTPPDGDKLPAVIGIVEGGWTERLSARIPSGVTVVVASHADKAGEKFFEKIWSTLAKRANSGALAVERWAP